VAEEAVIIGGGFLFKKLEDLFDEFINATDYHEQFLLLELFRIMVKVFQVDRE